MGPRTRRDWYPYYAGFTQEFASNVLDVFAGDADSIVDPWNGSGTTMLASVSRGIPAIGYDINPVSTVIARARMMPDLPEAEMWLSADSIVNIAAGLDHVVVSDDPLLMWMRESAVANIRSLQHAIHLVTDFEWTGPAALDTDSDGAYAPARTNFFYCALFATTRDLLERFRATNPTWLKDPDSPRNRIAPRWDTIADDYKARSTYLAERLTLNPQDLDVASAWALTESATAVPVPSDSFGGCLTSPPYATRIDYVRNVLPELAILGLNSEEIRELRQVSTGTPVVKDVLVADTDLSSKCGLALLRRVKAHSSKGSKSYYFPWLMNYLKDLQAGLQESARIVRSDGPLCVVVQDSHIKELHVDIQKVVTEMMNSFGRELTDRIDYDSRTTRASMNPHARKHLPARSVTESLLIFT